MTPDVYLASSSPRRQELLAQLGVAFEVIHPQVDESRLAEETAADYVVRLALEKARAGWQMRFSQRLLPVIGADTCIALGDDILGKPHHKQQGLQMLERLSGGKHLVYSAVAVVGEVGCAAQEQFRLSCSEVVFRAIDAQEREAYWDSGEPLDKAGGYAIQGKAAAFVKNIIGSYSGIVGLPLFETAELLKYFGLDVVRRN